MATVREERRERHGRDREDVEGRGQEAPSRGWERDEDFGGS